MTSTGGLGAALGTRRGRLLTAGAILVVAAVAAVVTWLLHRPADAGTPHDSTAGQVATALDRLATDPAALVATDARATVGDRAAQAVPKGTTVDADAGTWRPDGAGGGTMQVTLTPPGADPVTYLAVVVQEDGGWKVLGTLPVETGDGS